MTDTTTIPVDTSEAENLPVPTSEPAKDDLLHSLSQFIARMEEDVVPIFFSGKSGELVYSFARVPLTDKRFIIGINTFKEGWVCWKDGVPVGDHSWDFGDHAAAIAEKDLEDYGPYEQHHDGWRRFLSFQLMDTDSIQYRLRLATKANMSNFLALAQEIGGRLDAGEPAVPVVTIDSVRVPGKFANYMPRFRVFNWLFEEGIPAYLAKVNSQR